VLYNEELCYECLRVPLVLIPFVVQLFSGWHLVSRENNMSAVLYDGPCYSCLQHMYGYINRFPVIHEQLGTLEWRSRSWTDGVSVTCAQNICPVSGLSWLFHTSISRSWKRNVAKDFYFVSERKILTNFHSFYVVSRAHADSWYAYDFFFQFYTCTIIPSAQS
jgi:hypothetical protein